MKVLVVGSKIYGEWISNFSEVTSVEEADIVVFTGGEDISPEIYGETKHYLTQNNLHRDKIEHNIFQKAVEAKKFIVGICRGSQFTTVMAGGKLAQHVNGHAIRGTHKIKTKDGVIMDATSTHHQMMYPFNIHEDRYELLASAESKLSDVYFKNSVNIFHDIEKEPEVVFYKNINALAIQPHPEYMDEKSDLVIWLNELIITLGKFKK